MVRRPLVVLVLAVILASPATAQCGAWSSVTFTNQGAGCQPTGPSWCVPNLYAFHGSCSVSLALVGPSAAFVAIAVGTQPGSGSTSLPLPGGSCPIWVDGSLVILDLGGQSLSQVTFQAPPFSLAGLVFHAQAVYAIDCGIGAISYGTTQGLAVQFN